MSGGRAEQNGSSKDGGEDSVEGARLRRQLYAVEIRRRTSKGWKGPRKEEQHVLRPQAWDQSLTGLVMVGREMFPETVLATGWEKRWLWN